MQGYRAPASPVRSAATLPADTSAASHVARPPRRPAALVRTLATACAVFTLAAVHGHEDAMEQVTVSGRALDLTGTAGSASQGRVGAADLARRPLLRSGELLEVVPGAAVTQHSGTGKANQYFLRGFNLDHGTDFAGFLDGVPLNLPTHGHGQGYLDLNPIIPELVEDIAFGKGPYYADVGDFSSAGYARYRTRRHLHDALLNVSVGENGFYRGVAAGSTRLGAGDLLAAVEAQHYDGPWVQEENAHKLNAMLKYTGQLQDTGYALSLLAYDANWDSTDQVPLRAIERGRISRLGSIDDSLGGRTTRYSANLELARASGDTQFDANVYAVYSDFSLFSNFTYFLDDPVNGDQITQQDRRWMLGLNTAWAVDHDLLGAPSGTRVGLQLRHDRIADVALSRSRGRRFLGAVRDDSARQTSLGLFVSNQARLTPWLRLELGLRVDHFRFDVNSSLAANTGSEADTIFSPKAGLILGPWRSTELYLNVGQAFHSNDARGTVTRVDPASGGPAEPVDPLVKSTGTELGLRTTLIDGLQSTLALWYLELDSELVFVGDAGTTEPAGQSRRYGVEWSNFYRVNRWLTLDLDVALTESRFTAGREREIPNAVGRVITAGASLDLPGGLFGALRLRHFGDSPLSEDGAVKADATTMLNLRAGYRFGEQLTLTLDVFNLLDARDPDISYFFASCLPEDPAAACGAGLAERGGVEDVHLHPVEPRQLRAMLSWRF